jgi:flagellar motor switch protein FliM
VKRQLTEQQIDDYFATSALADGGSADSAAVPFDFRRSGQIPQSQLQALQFLHEEFVRNLSSSLSLYLRSDVSGKLISVEQSSFGKLADSLPSPTCMLHFTTQPREGNILLEVNQSLVAPILDCVLGGDGKVDSDPAREITDIEKHMLEEFFHLIGRQLREAWKSLVPVSFVFHSVETNPALSRRMGRDEAIVAVAVELHIGEKSGMVNLAIPAMTLKLLGSKSDPQAMGPKPGSGETAEAIKERLSAGLKLDVECALVGSNIRLRDLLNLKVGDLIDLGIPCDGIAAILVNGVPKFSGEVTVADSRQAVVIQSAYAVA